MLELLSDRQRQLISRLHSSQNGCSIDELATALEVTKNAVRQQLVGLERDGLVAISGTEATGGRPRELYALTDRGREIFPRQYSWFGELLLGTLKEQLGGTRLKEKLFALGQSVGQSVATLSVAGTSRAERAAKLAQAMTGLGYSARHIAGPRGAQTLEAKNCVFHRLAQQHPEVCQFDLGLMSAFSQSSVTHGECMVRGGQVCRFVLGANSKGVKDKRGRGSSNGA